MEIRGTRRSWERRLVALAVAAVAFHALGVIAFRTWLRNLLMAGTGGLKVKGVRYAVSRPRVLVATEVLCELPSTWRMISRLYRFGHFLRVVATPITPSPAQTDPHAGRTSEPSDANA